MGSAYRGNAPHHSEPCLFPTRSGKPCPNRGLHQHDGYGTICQYHRVRLQQSEHLNRKITVAFQAQEFDQLRTFARASGCSVPALIRAQIFHLPIPKPLPPIADGELLAALGRVGNGINQIARALNILVRDVHLRIDPAIVRVLQKEIAALRELMLRLIELATMRASREEEPTEEWGES